MQAVHLDGMARISLMACTRAEAPKVLAGLGDLGAQPAHENTPENVAFPLVLVLALGSRYEGERGHVQAGFRAQAVHPGSLISLDLRGPSLWWAGKADSRHGYAVCTHGDTPALPALAKYLRPGSTTATRGEGQHASVSPCERGTSTT